MSWTGTSGTSIVEDEEVRAMKIELEKQQEAAAELILQKQKKKEQQQLSRQRKRKEKQDVRLEQQQQQQGQQQQQQQKQRQKCGRKSKNFPRKSSPSSTPRKPSPSSNLSSRPIASVGSILTALDTVASASFVIPNSTPSSFSRGGPILVASKNNSNSAPQMATILGHGQSPTVRDHDDFMRSPSGGGFFDPYHQSGRVDRKRSDLVLERTATLLELSRFQCDYVSDEDAMEVDYYEPLTGQGDYFTQEEAVRLYLTKLRRLKAMYLHQAESVKLSYKEKRKLYLQAIEELENSNISYTSNPNLLLPGKSKVTPEFIQHEKLAYRKLKYLKKYQNFKGTRSVTRMQAKKLFEEKLAKQKLNPFNLDKNLRSRSDSPIIKTGVNLDNEETDSANEESDEETDLFELIKLGRQNGVMETGESSSPSTKICIYHSEHDFIKCSHLALPLSKYCYSHILKDDKQTLFKVCGRPLVNKEQTCQVTVHNLMEKLGCKTHLVPIVRSAMETRSKKLERLKLEASLPIANTEEEVSILEDFIVGEMLDKSQFDETLKYLEAKGLRCPDTDDSEEDTEEFESDFSIVTAPAMNGNGVSTPISTKTNGI